MKKSVNKKGGFGIILLVVVVILALGIGSYFIFFLEKCKDNEIFNPYQDVCVGKRVLCNLDRDCTLLEGQTGFFTEESLSFELISARNDDGRGFTTINIAGLGEVNMIEQDDFDFREYTIGFESVDGDPGKIMGASFEVTKNLIIEEDFGSLKFQTIYPFPRTPNSELFVEGKYTIYFANFPDEETGTSVFISKYTDENAALENFDDVSDADESSGFFGRYMIRNGIRLYEIKEKHNQENVVDYSLIWISGDKHIIVTENGGNEGDADYNSVFEAYLNKYPSDL